MASASPPKPWERGGSTANNNAVSTALASTPGVNTADGSTTTAPTSSINPDGSPAIPARPSSLTSVANRNASTYSNPSSTFGNRPYGGYGSSYSSPYNRFGSGIGGGMYGSSMYGGGMYGSSMYGGGMYGGGMYGSGMGMGMGGYGGMNGMNGMQPDPNDPNSMTNNFQQSTQATFQIIESIVGAFGGFAQMLESTYMATHSSFFAMVSVAEQFGNLRQTLGSVLGIYTLLRWLRTLIAKLTGRPPPADATALTPSNFAAFTGSPAPMGPDGKPLPGAPPRPSKKPFIVFLLAVFGLPYLMGKLIRALAKSQEEAMQNQHGQIQGDNMPFDPNNPHAAGPNSKSLDPSKLDFCRLLYDFPPPSAIANGTFDGNLDLQVQKGDLVAVLDKSDPNAAGSGANADAEWWRCRARDGRMGYLPAVYLETIQRKPTAAQITNGSPTGSLTGERSQSMGAGVTTGRAQTMASSVNGVGGNAVASRASTISDAKNAAREQAAKGDKAKGLESFQKAWVNDR